MDRGVIDRELSKYSDPTSMPRGIFEGDEMLTDFSPFGVAQTEKEAMGRPKVGTMGVFGECSEFKNLIIRRI